jgi:hypothetical protein
MERCANITSRGRRRRLLTGLVGAALAAGVVWLQITLDLPRAVRLLSIGPLLLATYGFFQAREQTCVRLAWSGQRETAAGVVPIDDPAELYRVRKQASVVHASAIISALAVAAVLYVI